jgi:hypothetical protein
MPSPPRIDEVILDGELSHAQVAAIAAGLLHAGGS